MTDQDQPIVCILIVLKQHRHTAREEYLAELKYKFPNDSAT